MKIIGLLAAGLLLTTLPVAAQKKKDLTQVLELPKDPPPAVVAATRNLLFQVSPLTTKGLLSQQTREAMKALIKMNSGNTIVRIRAFVAGSGDMRRVPAIVSETMTDKKMALPVLSVVQAGALPLEGAQVILEAISVGRREVNPNGIVFVGGQRASQADPLSAVMPLAQQSLVELDRALNGVAGEVLRVTCYTSSRDEAPKIQMLIATRYPQAATDVITMQRASSRGMVECEATARLAKPQKAPLEIVNQGRASAVSAQKIVLTGTQMAFGVEDKDARLAFQRLAKALEPLGTSAKEVAMADFYPLSNGIAEQIRKIRTEFFSDQRVPATTMLPFEGLPSMGASFAVDVAAVINQ